jgi:TRAP-type C4-dicarboxylate transport system permease small subunit
MAKPHGGLRAGVQAVMDRVDWLSTKVIIAAFAAMVGVVSAQVLFRYVLNLSLDWADEVARLTFVWATFLGVPHGVKRGAHVGIDLVAKLLPGPVYGVIFRACCAVSAALMAIVAWQSVAVAAETWDQLMPVLDFSTGWFYVAITVCGVHSAVHFLLAAWDHAPMPPAGRIAA